MGVTLLPATQPKPRPPTLMEKYRWPCIADNQVSYLGCNRNGDDLCSPCLFNRDIKYQQQLADLAAQEEHAEERERKQRAAFLNRSRGQRNRQDKKKGADFARKSHPHLSHAQRTL